MAVEWSAFKIRISYVCKDASKFQSGQLFSPLFFFVQFDFGTVSNPAQARKMAGRKRLATAAHSARPLAAGLPDIAPILEVQRGYFLRDRLATNEIDPWRPKTHAFYHHEPPLFRCGGLAARNFRPHQHPRKGLIGGAVGAAA